MVPSGREIGVEIKAGAGRRQRYHIAFLGEPVSRFHRLFHILHPDNPDRLRIIIFRFCNSFSPYYAGDENDLETVEVNEELTALHGIETSGEWISESYVFKGDFTGQGFYNITISMSQKDYKKYKKIISQMVASCQIREWEPENATVSESIENVEKYSK